MSKEKEEFSRILGNKEPSMGPVEAAREGIKTIAPGLSMSKILGEIGEELKHQVSAGAHELAAALFNQNAFVMYPRQGHDDPQPSKEHQKEVEQDRGGLSM
jgi:hypothetical protein